MGRRRSGTMGRMGQMRRHSNQVVCDGGEDAQTHRQTQRLFYRMWMWKQAGVVRRDCFAHVI